MAQDKREVINIVAAVLRGLMSAGEQLGIISFDDSKTKDQADVQVALGINESAEKIVSALKEKLAPKTKSVFVEDLGLFRRQDELVSGVSGRVAGKVCVVTGAARGFGLEIAKDLVKEGACVVLADINDSEAIMDKLVSPSLSLYRP